MTQKNTISVIDESIRLRVNRHGHFHSQHIDPEAVRTKVLEDIHFLRHRIDHLKRSKSAGNTTILATYESMLNSRESVLAWLGEADRQDPSVSNM